MARRLPVLALLLAVLGLHSQSASAHPGDHYEHEVQAQHRQLLTEDGRRALAACASSHHAGVLHERTIRRRAAKLEQLRQLSSAATSHKSKLTGVSATNSDPKVLFGSTPKCILEPEVTLGPYYVSGELLRTDVREKQQGVELYTELQVIDVNTCKPVESLYIDFWHCNATGVYSGIVANGNGDTSDSANLNATFNRGLAPTDADGVVTFRTTFPGHYTGRAVHIHVLGTHNGTLLRNSTYSGGKVAHVGQIFFDQDLVASVRKTSVYATNKQELTPNAKDGIFAEASASGFDPIVEYALLGDSVDAGIFSWISIGVNMSLANTVSGAAAWTTNGGIVTNSNGNGFDPERGGKGPPPLGNSEANASAEAAKPVSFVGRNVAIIFLLFLGFLMSPYNRWIPVPCRLGGESGGDASAAAKYAQISRT
ncbi:hypothetical protein Gpo141_00004590 [Globisporangium polare]